MTKKLVVRHECGSLVASHHYKIPASQEMAIRISTHHRNLMLDSAPGVSADREPVHGELLIQAATG